jgi:hypothetical protein
MREIFAVVCGVSAFIKSRFVYVFVFGAMPGASAYCPVGERGPLAP